MSDTPVVTRFAPSPTGQLHIGGARTALFAWAYARQQNGRFILRMEDTDQSRSSVESTRAILRDLQWLGLDWDEGPAADAPDPMDASTQRGEHGPYFQSQRLDIYQQHIEKLLASGHAHRPEDEPDIVRLRMDKDVAFKDEVYGNITVPQADLEDFVIQKSDGFPTFHLAVVVDDALMGVNHVIRGQEHLSNTPKHVAIQDALGFDRPIYVHMPSIMNPDGSKMSKRDKAKIARQAAKQANLNYADLASPGFDDDAFTAFMNKKRDDVAIAEVLACKLGLSLPEIEVLDFARSGYLPEALLNYLSLLGWNPGDNIERFDIAFLIEKIGFDRMGKSNSKFDRAKLLSFNADTIAALPADRFAELLAAHWKQYHAGEFKKIEPNLATFCAAYQQRAKTLSDPAEQGRFLWIDTESIEYDAKAVKKTLHKNDGAGLAALGELREQIADMAPWSGEAVHELIKTLSEKTGDNMGKYAQPLRVALTGNTVSPPIDQTLDMLGKETTLARIDRCLQVIEQPQA